MIHRSTDPQFLYSLLPVSEQCHFVYCLFITSSVTNVNSPEFVPVLNPRVTKGDISLFLPADVRIISRFVLPAVSGAAGCLFAPTDIAKPGRYSTPTNYIPKLEIILLVLTLLPTDPVTR
jgi:hypothetical protein